MKSIVEAYCGGRGSGKTLSMSVAGAFGMKHGKQVWSNYPIKFHTRNENGEKINYESHLIEIEDLITFRKDINNGYVLLDELNLWASNRGSNAIINRLLNSWIQLIRHRKLCIYLTTQAFETLDKVIRWQTDLICECFDLSFKYSNLKEGQLISQKITDYSGVFTGRPLTKLDDYDQVMRNTTVRILRGIKFHGIYDTMSEFDILKAMTRYEVQRETKVIADGQAWEKGYNGYKDSQIATMLDVVKYENPSGVSLKPDELRKMLQENNISKAIGKNIAASINDQGFYFDTDKKAYIWKPQG